MREPLAGTCTAGAAVPQERSEPFPSHGRSQWSCVTIIFVARWPLPAIRWLRITQRVIAVKCEIEFQHVDTRLAEKTPLALLRVLLN